MLPGPLSPPPLCDSFQPTSSTGCHIHSQIPKVHFLQVLPNQPYSWTILLHLIALIFTFTLNFLLNTLPKSVTYLVILPFKCKHKTESPKYRTLNKNWLLNKCQHLTAAQQKINNSIQNHLNILGTQSYEIAPLTSHLNHYITNYQHNAQIKISPNT